MIEYTPTKMQSNTMLLFGTPVLLYDKFCTATVHDTSTEQK